MGILGNTLCLAGGLAALFLFLIAPKIRRGKRGEPLFPCVPCAHRGLHDQKAGIPENSLAAFERAAQAGVGVEMDVRLTADGELVVFHDETLWRLFGSEKKVPHTLLEEIKALRLPGSGETIPTLDEALFAIRGRVPIVLEIKSRPFGKSDIAQKVMRRMEDYKGVFCVESFDPLILRVFRRRAPRIIRGQLVGAPGGKAGRHIRFFTGAGLLFDFLSRPDFVAYDVRGEKSFILRVMRIVFRPMAVAWTVRSQQDFERNETRCDFQIFESFLPLIPATIDMEKENEP